MQPQAMQMIAERLGMSAEQMTALQAGDPSSLLASGKFTDPMAAMLAACMIRRAPDEEAAPGPEEELARARRSVRKLKEVLATAGVMIRHVAETFGACGACWGQNALCRHCEGHGTPGSGAPAEEGVRAWAEPALRKLGLKVVSIEDKG